MYFCFSLFSNPVAMLSAVTPPLPGRSITVVVNQRQVLISHVIELTQDDPIRCCRVEFSWFFLPFSTHWMLTLTLMMMVVMPAYCFLSPPAKNPPKKQKLFFMLICEFTSFIHTSVLSIWHE